MDKPKILIVDSSKKNYPVYEELLSELDVNLIKASSGKEAQKKCAENDIALMLLELQQIEEKNTETLDLIRQRKKTEFIPAIFISEKYSKKLYIKMEIETGAIDFITKPIIPEILLGKVNIFLNLSRQKKLLEDEIEKRIKAENRMQDNIDYLKNNIKSTIKAMSLVVEFRDPYTAGHQDKVAMLSAIIAAEMKLPDDQIEGIEMAASIHDLGKIQIPAEILSKPCKISIDELELVKIHPKIGYDILKTIEFPWPLAKIVLQHHEKIDGSGYPNGTSADDILLEAKIISVADVIEAMSSHRPYRPALGVETALAEIEDKKGKLYDPDVVDACVEAVRSNRNGIADYLEGRSKEN